MRLATLQEIETGTRLAKDVWGASDALPLLRAGVRLSDGHKGRLVEGGIEAVYIDDELSRGIHVPMALRSQTRTAAATALSVARTELGKHMGPLSEATAERVVAELDRVIDLMLSDLQDIGDVVVAMSDLATVDAYTMKHSIDVTVLGLLVGRRYIQEFGWIDYTGHRRRDREDNQLRELGMGLLLHDIGKLAIPGEILHKSGKLTQEEWEVMRAHPDMGVKIVARTPLSFRSIGVIQSHHEREDGTGYPDGLKGPEIHLFAKIAAVADVYDAMTAQRAWKAAVPPVAAWTEIMRGAGTIYDKDVVGIFRKVVPPYPPGTTVKLADGRTAIVAQVESDRIEDPLVRVVTDAAGERCTPVDVPLAEVGVDAIAGSEEHAAEPDAPADPFLAWLGSEPARATR